MSSPVSTKSSTKEWLQPFYLAVPFSTIVTGLAMSNNFPFPVALLVGAVWGIALGLVATWIKKQATLSAWLEDAFVMLGATALAFAAGGGMLALLMLDSALDSPSLTGETLVQMFLPMIPFYIIVNSSMELLIIPGLLYLGWRAGTRRILIIVVAALFFALRVWTYLAFVPNRLAFGELGGKSTPFTAAERQQAFTDLQLDDPRAILGLPILAVMLLAMHFSRVRELKTVSAS